MKVKVIAEYSVYLLRKQERTVLVFPSMFHKVTAGTNCISDLWAQQHSQMDTSPSETLRNDSCRTHLS